MGTTLAQAYETAKSALGDGLEIYSASQSTARWFFFFGTRVMLGGGGETEPLPLPGGGSVIAISKETGEEVALDLPPMPSFVTGSVPTPDEEEVGGSEDVPLP